jgi:hypothetical protein
MIVLLLALQAGWAWGDAGHRRVADVAELRLADDTHRALAPLLESATLADVSVRMDERKADSGWDWAKPLHYVNIAKGAPGYDRDRDCPDGTCVVAAVAHYAHVLGDPARTVAERRLALEMVTHLVGDLHQPLHVGFAEDRGGNSVTFDWQGESWSVHAFWDAYLPRQPGVLDAGIAGEVGGSVVDWADESWAHTNGIAYFDGEPDQAWVDAAGAVASDRIATAGVRLAWLLDQSVQGTLPFAAPDVAYPTGPVEEPSPVLPLLVVLLLAAGVVWWMRRPREA